MRSSADDAWRLRRASPSDAAAVALVASACFLETYVGFLPGADIVAHCAAKNSPAAFAAWSADPTRIVTIAEHEATSGPGGYTMLAPPDLPIGRDDGDIELVRIYALQRAQGTGLGKALMARAIDDAGALGKRRVLLGTNIHNARARAFYERQGFAVIGERTFYVGATRNDDVIYARQV